MFFWDSIIGVLIGGWWLVARGWMIELRRYMRFTDQATGSDV